MRTRVTGDWVLPGFCVVLGLVFLGAALAGGQPVLGISSLIAMLVYAAILVAMGSRSETVAVLRGQPADERLAGFTEHATAHAGAIALVVPLAAYVWDIAHGGAGTGYLVILVPAGLAFFASLAWQQRRS